MEPALPVGPKTITVGDILVGRGGVVLVWWVLGEPRETFLGLVAKVDLYGMYLACNLVELQIEPAAVITLAESLVRRCCL